MIAFAEANPHVAGFRRRYDKMDDLFAFELYREFMLEGQIDSFEVVDTDR